MKPFGMFRKPETCRSRPSVWCVLLAVGLVLAVSSPGNCRSAAAEMVDSLADGPHIYWQDDSTAIVIYYCAGVVDTLRFRCSDTLVFRGFCQDTGMTYTIPVLPPDDQPSVVDGVSRILAVSDIHGRFEYLVSSLQRYGVIGPDRHWTWGDGHLVVNGDVFDRGAQVTECLWLIHQLELEAERDGGGVHYLLGNHELMVLRGDNRYVNRKYLEGISKKTRIRHEDLFGAEMELGRWLRSKPAVLKLNGLLFVHGGLAPLMVERGMDLGVIGDVVRRSLDMPSSRLVFNDLSKLILGGQGPFWYRGYHYEMEDRYPQATAHDIDRLLAFYDSETIVVGHTQRDSLSSLYDGRVIDLHGPYRELRGFEALLWEHGSYYRLTTDGRRILLK